MLPLRKDIRYVEGDGKLTQAGVEAIQGQIDSTNTTLGARLTAVEAELAGSLINLQTAQTASGQTEFNFTGIPAWANRITVMFDGISTNGTSLVQVQIGDSGGVETSGYSGTSTAIAATVSTDPISSGFEINQSGGATAAATQHGSMSLNRLTGNTWACVASFALSNTARSCLTVGTKTLSATLDRVRITTIGGANTFDAGSVNISWE